MRWPFLFAVLATVGMPGWLQAGLHYSGEPLAELPSQWRGFLTDLRTLRNIAVKPSNMTPASPLRQQYQEARDRLLKASQERPLTAEERADLGALLIRLGETDAALTVLREAQRLFPQHYAIHSNLGTAWQVYGDLHQAAEALRQAVTLAPTRFRKAEEAQLRLVRLRLREGRDSQELDDVFGIRYVGESGQFEAGKLATEQRKKLPPDAVAIAQQLALWLPADGRLLWQLAELANAHGDIRIASELFETCVGQFGLTSSQLREHRNIVRAASADLARRERAGSESAKTEHEGHQGIFTPKSRRPLAANRLDLSNLPPIRKDGVNPLPWPLLQETSVDRHFRPTFPKYLKELHDHEVTLTGFVQPLTDDLELSAFMLIEYPTGCWYCEMPEITGIVLVELPEGKSLTYTRNLVKVNGKLSLNATDPENFLYTVKGAKVTEAD